VELDQTAVLSLFPQRHYAVAVPALAGSLGLLLVAAFAGGALLLSPVADKAPKGD
jgi:hypothetical protein